MRSSCGALFYSYDPSGKLGVILGLEGLDWLPFKGCNENGETLEQTAIREIREETCGLVVINNINLEHRFTSKRKHYYIGLCQVPFNIVEEFGKLRVTEDRIEYREKKKLKFFPLNTALDEKLIHNITKASIRYFWNQLQKLDIYNSTAENLINNSSKDDPKSSSDNNSNSNQTGRLRKQSIPIQFAQDKYDSISTIISADSSDLSESSEISESSDVSPGISPSCSSKQPVLYKMNRESYRQIAKSQNKKAYKHIYKRPSTLLRQPAKFNIYHTPMKEKYDDMNRVWRKP